MMKSDGRGSPFVKRIQSLRDKYRAQALGAIAAVVTMAVFVAQVVPEVAAYISDRAVLPYLIFLLVLDIAFALDTHSTSDARRDVRFMTNQDEALPELQAVVRGCRSIDLLEYAGATTLPLIRTIQREKVSMRLLVKHPDTVEGLQRQRMITTLDTLFNKVFFNQSDKFEIRCYRLPYGLRARYLHGRLLELGWLTADPERQTAFGHDNPSMLVDVGSSSKEHLVEFFERTFKTYWEHPETEDAREVLRRLQSMELPRLRDPAP